MNEQATGSAVEIHSHFIDGNEVEAATDRTVEVYNPATGRVIARTPDGGAADVDRAMASARRAFESPEWGGIDIRSRARLVTGGKAARIEGLEGGFFVEPTVFADVKPEMKIFQEEVFGPFTSVTPFRDEAEALALANNSAFALAAAVRTHNLARAHRVAAGVQAGIVWINDHLSGIFI
jgi:acyl-CoA reductase-like NAD-dependent aldehyde dehydrogenase